MEVMVFAEVFTADGEYLARATIPDEVTVPYYVHVSPFTDHVLVSTLEPCPRVLELRLIESDGV